MVNRLITHSISFAIILALGALICLLTRTKPNWHWVLASAGLIIVHDLFLTRAYGNIPSFFEGLSWNWTGKGLAFAIGVLMCCLIGRERTGLTLRHKDGSAVAFGVALGFTIIAFIAAKIFGNDAGTVEAILFQMTMPGLEEEVFYRGALLVAFGLALPVRWKVLGAETTPAFLLTAVLFGLIHGLYITDSGLQFAYGAVLFSFVSGLVFVWLKEKTGSLLLPIYAHNVWNTAFALF